MHGKPADRRQINPAAVSAQSAVSGSALVPSAIIHSGVSSSSAEPPALLCGQPVASMAAPAPAAVQAACVPVSAAEQRLKFVTASHVQRMISDSLKSHIRNPVGIPRQCSGPCGELKLRSGFPAKQWQQMQLKGSALCVSLWKRSSSSPPSKQSHAHNAVRFRCPQVSLGGVAPIQDRMLRRRVPPYQAWRVC